MVKTLHSRWRRELKNGVYIYRYRNVDINGNVATHAFCIVIPWAS